MPRILAFLTISFCLISCSKSNSRVKSTLDSAGSNRAELEKVLNHYCKSDDHLKLKAACFLIGNMTDKYFLTSGNFERFQQSMIDSIRKRDSLTILFENTAINKQIRNSYLNGLISKLINITKLRDTLTIPIKDCRYISAGFLIENIDLAFKAWDNPWAKKVSFDDFCNYILAYRCSNEKPILCRQFFMDLLKWLPDSMKGSYDPVKASILVNKFLENNYFTVNRKLKSYTGSFSPMFTYYVKNIGSCKELSALAVYAMRSVGIPVCEMSLKYWGNYKVGHTFNAVLDTNRNWVCFMGTEYSKGINDYWKYYTVSKLWLESFSKPTSFANSDNEKYDFTSVITKVSNLTLDMGDLMPDENTLPYLNTYGENAWVNIFQAQVKHKKVLFKNMGRNIVYLPTIMNNGVNVPLSYPILLDTLGNTKLFRPNSVKLIRMKLTRTYPLKSVSLKDKVKGLIGGRFEISNDPNFRNARTIYVVDSVPNFYYQTIPVKELARVSYVRLIFPKRKADWVESFTQVRFYDRNKNDSLEELTGKYIGSEDFDELKLKNLFAANMPLRLIRYEPGLSSFFNRDKQTIINKSDPEWAGIKLNKKTKIAAVGFYPRGDNYLLQKGKKYELLYWDNRWNSLGVKVAAKDTLTFYNVPSGALYKLHCTEEGKDERIFTYENDKQFFW